MTQTGVYGWMDTR